MSQIVFEVVRVSSWTADGVRYDAGEQHRLDSRSDSDAVRLLAAAVAAEPTHFDVTEGADVLERAVAKHVETDDASLKAYDRAMAARGRIPADVLEELQDKLRADERRVRRNHAKLTDDARAKLSGDDLKQARQRILERQAVALQDAVTEYIVAVDEHVQRDLGEKAKGAKQ